MNKMINYNINYNMKIFTTILVMITFTMLISIPDETFASSHNINSNLDYDTTTYVTGFQSNNVFKIAPDGTITEIIDIDGDGTGNNILRYPRDVETDSKGNLYVVGVHSHNVFKITPNGDITEIINEDGDGTGNNSLRDPYGLTVDYNDNVYVTGTTSNNVFKITPNGTITEIIDSTGDGVNDLQGPRDIDTDSKGNVYVSGINGNNVFKITPGGIITEIINELGDRNSGHLVSIHGLAVDSNDNVYVSGSDSDNVFKITPTGVITKIIDRSGDRNGGSLYYSYGLAVDSNDNVYVVGRDSDNVFKITPTGEITEYVDRFLNYPQKISVDYNNNIYVTSFHNNSVFKITTTGVITEIINSNGDGTGNILSRPYGIAIVQSPSNNQPPVTTPQVTLEDKTIFVSGFYSDNVFKIAPDGTITEIIDIDGDGTGNNILRYPRDVETDSKGNLYVVGIHSDNVFKITPDGTITEILNIDGDGTGNNILDFPYALAVDYNDNVYVVASSSNSGSDNIFKITPDGTITEIINHNYSNNGYSLSDGRAIDTDSKGNIYVVGTVSDNVLKITPDGDITEILNRNGAGPGKRLNAPMGIIVDYNDNVYVSGSYTDNVFKITPDGTITEIIDEDGAGPGKRLNAPMGIIVDYNDNVYVTGQHSHNAFKITPDGTITEIIDGAGDGTGNKLRYTYRIDVDDNNNVYVTGSQSNNVFKITPDGTITEIMDMSGDGTGKNILNAPNGITIPKLQLPNVTDEKVVNNLSKSRSGGCSNCTPPTLGLDNNGKLLVKDGITINGYSEDGGYYHTKYPMQYTNLGELNNINLKYFDDMGVNNITIVQLGIGVKEIGSPVSTSQALIEVHMNNFSNDIDNPTIKEILIIDDYEIISNESATVQLSTCSESYSTDTTNVKLSDSFDDKFEFYKNLIDDTCLSVNFTYSYDKIPDSWILLSNAIDYKRNTFNNYFNDGLTVIDTNPVIVIEEDTTYKYECKDTTQNVITRNNCNFKLIKQYEAQKSINVMNSICPTCVLPSYNDFEDSWAYDYPFEYGNRLDDPEIQSKMLSESEKAQKIMDALLDPILHLK